MSNPEDEYFARLDREKKDKLKAEQDVEATKAAAEERRKHYWHRCGKCGGEMATQVYRGTEIEICNDCGAVLLDQGELQALAGQDKSGVIGGLMDLFGGGRRT